MKPAENGVPRVRASVGCLTSSLVQAQSVSDVAVRGVVVDPCESLASHRVHLLLARQQRKQVQVPTEEDNGS